MAALSILWTGDGDLDGPSKKNCIICFIESPLKIMKYAFYFILKALFVLKILRFLSQLLVNMENGLIRKIRLTSKVMTSQPGLQTITNSYKKHIAQYLTKQK